VKEVDLTGDDDIDYSSQRGPLGGLSFVITGVFEDITRENLELFVRKNGGRLLSSVSSKTGYLIIGKVLDDNRPVTDGNKYKKAEQLGRPILTERQFEELCKQKFKDPGFLLGRHKKDTTEGAEDLFIGYSEREEVRNVKDISDLVQPSTGQQDEEMKEESKVAP